MSEITIFLLGVLIGLTGMGVTCWLLDTMSKEDEDECEVVVPHCTYGTCTDYPHCAGCGAAEWTRVEDEDE